MYNFHNHLLPKIAVLDAIACDKTYLYLDALDNQDSGPHKKNAADFSCKLKDECRSLNTQPVDPAQQPRHNS